MRRILMILPLLAASIAPALAQTAQQRLQNALAFEWYLANCDQAQQANAMMAMSAAMAINGHTVSDVAAQREQLHAQIADNFADPQEACSDYASKLAPK